jgi:hypothetical protein
VEVNQRSIALRNQLENVLGAIGGIRAVRRFLEESTVEQHLITCAYRKGPAGEPD